MTASTWALLLGGLLAAACVVYVARPFLREPAAARRPPRPARRARAASGWRSCEERDRALDALKELELDHRTGKVSDEDYRALVAPLRAEAARAMRALDRLAGGVTPPTGERRRMVRRAALVLVLAVVAAAPAGADTIEDRKQSVDSQIAALGARVENTQRREASLRAQVESASFEIRALAQRVNDISIDLEPLEHELELAVNDCADSTSSSDCRRSA